jgi:hypothetical protein
MNVVAGVTTRRTHVAGSPRAAELGIRGRRGDRLYTRKSLRGRFGFIRWNHPSATRAASHKTLLRKRREWFVRFS